MAKEKLTRKGVKKNRRWSIRKKKEVDLFVKSLKW